MISKLRAAISRQLSQPSGAGGRVIAAVMNRGNRGLNERAINLLDVRPSSRALDLGFGGGLALALLLERAAHVTAIDRAQDMVAAAEARHADDIAAGRLTVKVGDVGALPLADGSVDRILTVNTVYFWPDLVSAFSELQRVMAPGARVVIGIRDGSVMERRPRHPHHPHAGRAHDGAPRSRLPERRHRLGGRPQDPSAGCDGCALNTPPNQAAGRPAQSSDFGGAPWYGRCVYTWPMAAAKERWDFRVEPDTDRLVRQAADSTQRTLTDFVVDAALLEAERLLADRTEFVLAPEHWDQFVAALDRPPRDNPGLRKLFAKPSVFSDA